MMESRLIDVKGNKVQLAEGGAGDPVLYLHGFADLHSASTTPFPFHEKLAENFRLVAPAHPACAGSDEREDIDSIEDFVFHYIELLDELALDRFHLVGNCVGGWIAAELAVRYPDKLRSLMLIGAQGLFIQGQPIADLFWVAQPEDGVYYNDLRSILFTDPKSDLGARLYPDGRGDVDEELMRYKMFRFASRIGFTPPYFYDRKLIDRLSRYQGPTMILQGENDNFVPRAHAEAYAAGFGAGRLEIIPHCGHSVVAEKPAETAALVSEFLTSNP
jgi:pimeloyl-ACP methyl ester carboxylesterase